MEHFEPMMFGGGSGGGGVLEGMADGELRQHFVLDAEEDSVEVELARVGCAGHEGIDQNRRGPAGRVGRASGKWCSERCWGRTGFGDPTPS